MLKLFFLKLMYKKDREIHSLNNEICRLSKNLQSIVDIHKENLIQLDYYKRENFRKDELLKGK